MKRTGHPRALALLAAVLLGLPATAASGPLVIWHAYRGAEEQALRQAAAKFTEQTGQPVELLALPYDAFDSKLETAIPHGKGPDVFIFNHERVRHFQRLGLLFPATAFNRTDYLPNAAAALEIQGTSYGYPLALKSLALYVNRKLVPAPPATTAQLHELLLKLSHPDQNRFGLAFESGDPYFFAPFLFGFGGQIFTPDGKVWFDSPAMGQALGFIKGLQDQRLIPQEVSGALVKALFNQGNAAMVISGPWFAGEIDPDIDYQVVALPTVSQTGQPLRPFLGVEAVFVAAGAPHAQAAQQLARFLSLGEAALIRAVVGRQVPASLESYQRPRIQQDKLIASFREAAVNAVAMPNTPEMARWWEPMKLALRAVLQGATLPQDAGALADRRYRALNREKPPDSNPWPFGIVLGLAVAGLLGWTLRSVLQEKEPWKKRYPDLTRALLYVTPAVAGIALLVVIPLVVGLGLSLFHFDGRHYSFVGMANFWDILASHGYRMTEPLSFYFTLGVTILWTAVNVALHVSIGLALALLLKDPLLKLRGVYRVLLIVPWAVPNYITALMWKGMFHRQFGAINGILVALHIQPISWFTHFATSFTANLVTNTWLGFPFMMVVALGALQSIPQDLYEAAEVDGASRWTQFRRITLPLLKPALLPAVILGSIWTFNMFNIIYLVSGGEPGGATDILVSDAYRWAFQRNEQYGYAAAYSVLIFVVLFAYSALTKRVSREAAEVYG